jgi:glutathione S-transferase
MEYKLVIASKAYSSWSQRVWLAMRHFEILFEEIVLSYEYEDWKQRALHYSPTGFVPVLIARELIIWDSLAIFEFLNETHLDKNLWPRDSRVRALARCISAEMHSGFVDLRKFCPTNYRRVKKPRSTPLPEEAKADVARITEIWKGMIAYFGGPYLCGPAFTLADAMYAPVANRFYAYALSQDPIVTQYISSLRSLPAWKDWEKGAAAETFHLAATDGLD